MTGAYAQILSYNFVLAITASDVFIYNAFVTFHAHSRLHVRVGLQAPVFGIEFRQAEYDLLFIHRSVAAAIGPERDMGVALDVRPVDSLQIELGVYSGAPDEEIYSARKERSLSGNAGVRWYARGKDRPLATPQGAQSGFLTLGAAVLLRHSEANPAAPHLTTRRSTGGHAYATYTPDTFAHGRKFGSTVFAHGGYNPLYFQGEFTTSNQHVRNASTRGRLVEHAWQAGASLTIGGVTGWNGTTPDRAIFDRGLGALQLKARAHGHSVRSRGGAFLDHEGEPVDTLFAVGVSAGINWHLSANLRIQADYDWTTFGVDAKRLHNANEHKLFVGLTAGY